MCGCFACTDFCAPPVCRGPRGQKREEVSTLGLEKRNPGAVSLCLCSRLPPKADVKTPSGTVVI